MGKRKFIEKKNAAVYQVVHTSFTRDGAQDSSILLRQIRQVPQLTSFTLNIAHCCFTPLACLRNPRERMRKQPKQTLPLTS